MRTHLLLEAMKPLRSLNAFYDLGSHSRIHLHCCHIFRFFENFDCEVSRSGSDFQHFISRFEVCLREPVWDVEFIEQMFFTDGIYDPTTSVSVLYIRLIWPLTFEPLRGF